MRGKRLPWSSLPALALIVLGLSLALTSCSHASRAQSSLSRIKKAHEILSTAAPLREDMESLLVKLEDLGTRFQNAEDTLKEGKSLVRLAEEDLTRLREEYSQAEELLVGVSGEGGGVYARYAELLQEAIKLRLELLDLQEEYLRTISDFLDVLPYAEDRSQLDYYLESLDQLSRKMADKAERAGEAAERADSFRRDHGL